MTSLKSLSRAWCPISYFLEFCGKVLITAFTLFCSSGDLLEDFLLEALLFVSVLTASHDDRRGGFVASASTGSGSATGAASPGGRLGRGGTSGSGSGSAAAPGPGPGSAACACADGKFFIDSSKASGLNVQAFLVFFGSKFEQIFCLK